MHSTYHSLFFVAIAGLMSPWLSIRLFRGILPAVVIEIAIGYLIGPHTLHLASSNEEVDFMAAFGFSFLMFLSGIELDFALLFHKSPSGKTAPWIRGMLFFFVTLAFSLLLSLTLFAAGSIKDIFVTTLILSTTSVGIVTPALKEKGWLSNHFGQEVMVFALIADVFTLILFTGYITFYTTGDALSIIVVLLILLAFIFMYRFILAVRKLKSLGIVESATSEIGLRGSFALILAFLALSKTLGTEVVIGAFLAGAIISLLSQKHSTLINKLNSIGYGFLLPIFFVNVGMDFDVGTLEGSPGFWIAMCLCLAGMYLNKIIPALLFFSTYPFEQRAAAGMLLSSRLSLLIAASQIAAQTGILSLNFQNGFILLAVISCFISPLLFNKTMKRFTAPQTNKSKYQEIISINKETLPEGWELGQLTLGSEYIAGKKIRNLSLPQNILLVSIMRNDERIVPQGQTQLELFDVIQFMGEASDIYKLKSMLE